MSLATYHQKRSFQATPEPRGEAVAGRGPLRFVVQKHHASRLHYDFRLELDGTLKSWAVPKGPSLDPAVRRLAVAVEDHPLAYRTFEGEIPAGNYGAGRVIVWDEGTYSMPGANSRTVTEAAARAGLAAGRLSFELHGKKLRGAFSLVKVKKGEANAWLLLKKADEHATTADITADGRSVRSAATLDNPTQKSVGGGPRKRKRSPKDAPATPVRDVRPMLATLGKGPFDRPGWLFEVKWDGYRAIAEVGRDHVRLYSRNHTPFEGTFAPVVRSLRTLGRAAVLDGELVVLDGQGRARFPLLQGYQKTGRGTLVYYVFDLLALDGRDLRARPLRERKKLLRGLLSDRPNVRRSDHVEGDGVAFFRAAAAAGLEGIMAKDGASPYREGVRSPAWVKVKSRHRQEAVVGGFTAPRGRRTGLGALVLGIYDGPDLVYVGHTGGGLDGAGLTDLRERLDPLVQPECPFPIKPRPNAPVTWVHPEVVCEVEFQEWTRDGRMRQPIFIGLREDKPPKAVHREVLTHDDLDAREPGVPARRRPTKANDPPLTHPERVYWPADGYTKGDLIEYYRAVAPVMLPHLRDRPLSLHRHPAGIDGGGFFQKDVGRMALPPFVQTARLPADSTGKDVTYAMCQDEASLLYLANLGCIEVNPWLSRVKSIDRPDFLVIDLDPEALPFARVVAAAAAVHKVLDRVGVPSLCKTSGKRGLHIAVPLGAKYEHPVARQFAELVAGLVHEQLPKSTSLVRNPAQRQRRVYLDYLQNRHGQTLAAPYSARPVAGATVSAPLHWREVRRGLHLGRFTIRTMPARVDKVGDLWLKVAGPGADLAAAVERLSRATGRTIRKSRRARAGGAEDARIGLPL